MSSLFGGRRTEDLLEAPAPFVKRPEQNKGLLHPQRFMNMFGLIVFVAAMILPFVSATPYIISILTSALIYVMLAMGLNVVVGYAGLLDLGYVAFFAVGAYTSGILSTRLGWSVFETIPVVLLACVAAGIIIGGPTLRLRTDYLAIVTLGFGEIVRLTANNLEITGGPSGIHGIRTISFFGWSLDDGMTLLGIDLNSKVLFYYFCLIVAGGLAVIGAARLGKGRLGRAWKSVRDDEDAAEAMGINTYRVKLSAYIIGAIWGGLAGVLMGSHLTAVSPTSFEFLYSALVLMAVVLGGMGSTPGVIIGALFISLAPELLREFADWRYLIFGVLMVVTMIFRPKGVWPATALLPWLHRRSPMPSAAERDEPDEQVVPTVPEAPEERRP